MAKLTSAGRKKLKPSQFAGPGRSYPDEDKSHADDAKARASEMFNKGHISAAEKASIDRKADKVIARSKGKK